MSAHPATSAGRIDITKFPVPGRLQLGGRRPPFDGDGKARVRSRVRLHRLVRRRPHHRLYGAAMCALASVLASGPAAQAAALPDLTGVYRCEGNASACARLGSQMTVTQSGSELQIRSDKGQVTTAKLTSDATLTGGPDLNNMHGIIRTNERPLILWADGAAWRKQQVTATN